MIIKFDFDGFLGLPRKFDTKKIPKIDISPAKIENQEIQRLGPEFFLVLFFSTPDIAKNTHRQ